MGLARFMARGVTKQIVNVAKSVGELMDPNGIGWYPPDRRPMSVEEVQAVTLMSCFCPQPSTPDPKIGTSIAQGFSQCLPPRVSPPVLSKSVVIAGNEARLPYYGIEGFVTDNVIRSIVYTNAQEYHTVVAQCRPLSFEDLVSVMKKTVMERNMVPKLIKWWTRFCHVVDTDVQPPTSRATHPTTSSSSSTSSSQLVSVQGRGMQLEIFVEFISHPFLAATGILRILGSEKKNRALLRRIAADPPFQISCTPPANVKSAPFLLAYQAKPYAENKSSLPDIRLGSKYIFKSVDRRFEVVGSPKSNTALTISLRERLRERGPLLVSPIIISCPLVSGAASIIDDRKLEFLKRRVYWQFIRLERCRAERRLLAFLGRMDKSMRCTLHPISISLMWDMPLAI
jgi:hypothetical protein